MATLPTNRNTGNTAAEHVADHNSLHGAFNGQDIWVTTREMAVANGATESSFYGPMVIFGPSTDGQAATPPIFFPTDWATCHVDILWLTSNVGSGNAIVRCNSAENTVDTTNVTWTTGGNQTLNLTAGTLVWRQTRLLTSFTLNSGKFYYFQIERDADNASDTSTENLHLSLVRFIKAS